LKEQITVLGQLIKLIPQLRHPGSDLLKDTPRPGIEPGSPA
jgi:hypothetical protein